MSDEIRSLLARIDERTENIDRRQSEEIRERKELDKRVSSLESWRNFYGGVIATVTALLGVKTSGH